MNNNTILLLNKLLTSCNVSVNDLLILSNYLQKEYMVRTVDERIIHMINNSAPYMRSGTENKVQEAEIIDVLVNNSGTTNTNSP